jgi:hypothetical protein
LSESPFWLHLSQMRFSVFDSPALIRLSNQVALDPDPSSVGCLVQMTAAVAVVAIAFQASSFANALYRF